MKVSIVARGRGKFAAPKPGGRCIPMKPFPDFRGVILAIYETSYKYKRMIFSTSEY